MLIILDINFGLKVLKTLCPSKGVYLYNRYFGKLVYFNFETVTYSSQETKNNGYRKSTKRFLCNGMA